MTAATMLIRFIWKPLVLVKLAARRVRPVSCSRTLGGREGKVWKCNGRLTSFTACQRGSHTGCHMGSMSQQPELGHAVDLPHRAVDVAVGQAGQPDASPAILTTEVDEPVVVDAEHLGGG